MQRPDDYVGIFHSLAGVARLYIYGTGHGPESAHTRNAIEQRILKFTEGKAARGHHRKPPSVSKDR